MKQILFLRIDFWRTTAEQVSIQQFRDKILKRGQRQKGRHLFGTQHKHFFYFFKIYTSSKCWAWVYQAKQKKVILLVQNKNIIQGFSFFPIHIANIFNLDAYRLLPKSHPSYL